MFFDATANANNERNKPPPSIVSVIFSLKSEGHTLSEIQFVSFD
jgi:hypothetical protein